MAWATGGLKPKDTVHLQPCHSRGAMANPSYVCVLGSCRARLLDACSRPPPEPASALSCAPNLKPNGCNAGICPVIARPHRRSASASEPLLSRWPQCQIDSQTEATSGLAWPFRQKPVRHVLGPERLRSPCGTCHTRPADICACAPVRTGRRHGSFQSPLAMPR